MVRRSRCCVIAAHPNDEIVGGGCLISKLPNVVILHISNGCPRTLEEARELGFDSTAECAEARRNECLSALKLARVPHERVVDFGVNQLAVPLQLSQLSRRLLGFLQAAAPQIVLTHAYEGGHPDHDATAFAVHAATRLLEENGLKPPVVFEMALYPGQNDQSRIPEFLHHPSGEITTLMLDDNARDLKRRMFQCFPSQEHVLSESPLGPEKFRKAPNYDFTIAPHNGKLHYENFAWGLTGREWRAYAGEALEELFPRSRAHHTGL
jgi:LmbE family N-acetylglucosaminyl deacetylase